MYHSIFPNEYNHETLRLLDEDLQLVVVVATVAFTNGINVRSLVDSISIGCADTLNAILQQMGRVGRAEGVVARAYVLIQKGALKKAKEALEGMFTFRR